MESGAGVFTGPTNSNMNVVIDTLTAGFQAKIGLYDAGVPQWEFGKQTTNSFYLYRAGALSNAYEVSTSGDTTLGETGKTITIDVSGGGHLIINGLPTSSAGLTSGMIWLNSNVLTRVP
jgi:hypothetical protein